MGSRVTDDYKTVEESMLAAQAAEKIAEEQRKQLEKELEACT